MLEDEDSLERELSCGVCLELYQVPLQLPCMHTFCKQCLKNIVACSNTNKRLKCPDCRKNVDLGKGGIESLKRNFKLASIVDIYKQAAEKLTEKKRQSGVVDNSKSKGDKDPDYAFLTKVIKRTHQDPDDPFEPHIIDDLWGTFRRTNRPARTSRRPPAPPPPHSPTSPLRPAPNPPGTSSGDSSPEPIFEELPFQRRQVPPEASSGPPAPADDQRLEPSAPEYFSVVQSHTGRTISCPEGDILDGGFDFASIAAPPVPPRRSFPPPSPSPPPGRSVDRRPPIPVPRGNKKKAPAPPLPPRENLPPLPPLHTRPMD